MIRLACVVALSLVLGGCGEMALRQKERQMELIARDWCMTIRASQVIPVYPLTQDLMPGDVFVVQMPIAEQSSRYRDRGFLATDLQAARLSPGEYKEFYGAYEKTDAVQSLTLPRDWRAGAPAGSIAAEIVPPTQAAKGKPGVGIPWSPFARAGFPSYTFEVSNQGGLSAALPIQGIPIAFSATGAARAAGSVTIADAVTYGTDADHLYAALKGYLHDNPNSGLRPPKGQVWFLRVVTRVFAAKRFDVVLTATSTFGAGADVGAPKSVANTQAPQPLAVPAGLKDAPESTQKIVNDDLSNQTEARKDQATRDKAEKTGQALQGGLTVQAINDQLAALEGDGGAKGNGEGNQPKPAVTGAVNAVAGVVPGASVRATFASGRTIGFKETFTEPIVVGYHGFDVEIDSNGNIGAIVPSFAVLDQGAIPSPTTATTPEDQVYMALIDSLTAMERVNKDAVRIVVEAAAQNDPALQRELDKVKGKAPMSAWTAASHAWITAAPANRLNDSSEHRRHQAREWLAGQVKETDFRPAEPKKVEPPAKPEKAADKPPSDPQPSK